MPSPGARIVFPLSATLRGKAFETLTALHFGQTGAYAVLSYSTNLRLPPAHRARSGRIRTGRAGRGEWTEFDAILAQGKKRFLLEAKFYKSPISLSTPGVRKKIAQAQNLLFDGLVLVNFAGFTKDLLSFKTSLDLRFFSWQDLREDLLKSFSHLATSLLDPIQMEGNSFLSENGACLKAKEPFSFKESSDFLFVEDGLEKWVRRLPALASFKSLMPPEGFIYERGGVKLPKMPGEEGTLTPAGAWEVEDALTGFAPCRYETLRTAALALRIFGLSSALECRGHLLRMGYETGKAGTRDALELLRNLGFVEKAHALYSLNLAGQMLTRRRIFDSQIFHQALKRWPPYRLFSVAAESEGLSLTNLLDFFHKIYCKYEPYARNLFNPAKLRGLIHLYKIFG